jgi:hypothetical protein
MISALITFGGIAHGDSSGDDSSDRPPATSDGGDTSTTGSAESPSAEDVLKEVLKNRRERPVIKPTQPPPVVEAGPAGASVQSESVNVDSKVLGVAPGLARPKLRREGEFIPLRRGRLIRAPSGDHMLFVFEADAKQTQEPPMVLMPCGALESMEREVTARGDKLVFRISGQVFTYRGANYLLPMVWDIPPDKGNIQK